MYNNVEETSWKAAKWKNEKRLKIVLTLSLLMPRYLAQATEI
jgi:hypothetical protein